jgi:predicted exporter
MLLGMWTTAATFYGLLVVDFPSLQQLGSLIGHSMVLCGIFTLILVPALLPSRSARRAARPLTMPRLARWVDRRRPAILVAAAVLTAVLGAAAFTIRIDPTLDRLRSVTPGAVLLDGIARRFELPRDVYAIVERGPVLEPLLEANERLRADIAHADPSLAIVAASSLLPSARAQAERARAIDAARLSPAGVAAALRRAAAGEGFAPAAMEAFVDRLPRILASEPLTFDGYRDHGLGDLIGRFVANTGSGWLLASYVFPAGDADIQTLQRTIDGAGGGATLTGLPLVNRELADRFLPQFLQGLAIGTVIVVALILIALRSWRLSAMALAPAALGLIWAAGVLALARVELDLFAVFAVVTFVGIGVDYGIHLVHRYRERGHAAGAVEELAPVILVAAAITLLGYGTLVTSSYPPLQSIGLVSVVTVVTLAAASLLVLPALLPRDSGVAPAAGDGVGEEPAT